MTHLAQSGSVVLVSCYELGHAPHSLAIAAGFLRDAGFDADIVDLQIEPLSVDRLASARLVAISVPMHTALRLGTRVVERVAATHPSCHICVFGLYAPLNADLLTAVGAHTILGAECEPELVQLARRIDRDGSAPPRRAAPLSRLTFPPPRRDRLRGADHYARFIAADGREKLAGYTEASRGCLDTCRHCPVPAVYGGRFFVVGKDVVLADIASQVASGVQHITFGDPDFFNGPGHTMAIVRELSRTHPEITFDITTQVSHLLAHRDAVAELPELGCAFVVSAAESLSDHVLERLGKRHRRADFLRALELCDSVGLPMRPTFVTFTPWTTLADLRELVDFIAEHDLIEHVAPVQLAVRLLVPSGSLLLRRPELAAAFGELDRRALTHSWRHPDPAMDELAAAIARCVEAATETDQAPAETFDAILGLVYRAASSPPPQAVAPRARRKIPRLSEPWFC